MCRITQLEMGSFFRVPQGLGSRTAPGPRRRVRCQAPWGLREAVCRLIRLAAGTVPESPERCWLPAAVISPPELALNTVRPLPSSFTSMSPHPHPVPTVTINISMFFTLWENRKLVLG